MKLKYFLIAILFCSFSVRGQQVTVGGSVNVMLPSGSTTISQSTALSLLQQKFPSDGYTNNLISSFPGYTYYNLNGNILRLSYKLFDGRGAFLTNEKTKIDAIGTENSINTTIQKTSTITTFSNGNPTLLTYFTGGSVATYHFTCTNPYNTDILTGVLHFAVADKTTVTTMLNALLTTVYFIPRNVTFTMTNSSSSAVIVTFVNGPSNLTLTLQPGTTNSTVQVLSGLYSVLTIKPAIPGSTVTRTMTLGTRAPVTAPGNAFSNVVISPGSSDLTLTVQ